MALTDDLKAAIEKNLSAEVGDTLKKRLAQADVDAAACVVYKEKVAGLEKQLSDLYGKVKYGDELELAKSSALDAAQKLRDATTDSRIVALKEEHAKERVAEMKSLVLAVFANNHYKYSTVENGSLPAGCDQYGNAKTTGYNRTSTGYGEGAPPPPPVGSP